MNKLVWCVVLVAACGVEAPDDGTTATPRLLPNSLSPAELAAGALTTAVLDAGHAAAMATTADARAALDYAVGCALDATQSITFSVGGTSHTATGSVGLAPGWTAGALSATEAAWVSSCVLARVNLTSALVTISLRGDHAAYGVSPGEAAAYQIEEGAFWGNVFTDLGAVSGSSCDGVGQVADDSVGDLPLRECAEWDGVTGSGMTACGMQYAGLCSAACATGSPYAGCAVPGGAAAAAVVTSFVYGE